MTDTEIYQIKQALLIVETRLENDSNSCEFDYYLKLKAELINKLKDIK